MLNFVVQLNLIVKAFLTVPNILEGKENLQRLVNGKKGHIEIKDH